ncbi:type II toxin-antitoxin system VapC family toxin [Aerophototrophica crusticola]|uniref:Type II toxin-antitoxin system VapC family toxin n=1 Tax=Aerophototrophica crusticola TaxID=1709002 RepID=A0A858RBN0_9PROT|nr:type II toxin-antitoxin system VapC family toxin [Rhodospirillaceae bacterium B3]
MTTLLLDTHVFLWWAGGTAAIPRPVVTQLEADGQTLLMSAVSVWEITTKVRLGKLPPVGDLGALLARSNVAVIPIDYQDAKLAGEMEGEHRDPFDRMIVAQARLRNIGLVSVDTALDVFPIRRLWPHA